MPALWIVHGLVRLPCWENLPKILLPHTLRGVETREIKRGGRKGGMEGDNLEVRRANRRTDRLIDRQHRGVLCVEVAVSPTCQLVPGAWPYRRLSSAGVGQAAI